MYFHHIGTLSSQIFCKLKTRHTLNGAVMFVPWGPRELNTPLFLVRQLQVSRGVGSLCRNITGSGINTQLQLQNMKGACHEKMKQKQRKDIWLHNRVFVMLESS